MIDTNQTTGAARDEAGPMSAEEQVAMEAAIVEAQARPCTVEGCDGRCRNAYDWPADWSHEIGSGGVADVAWTVDVRRGVASLSTYESRGRYEMDAQQVRALAAEYETLPAKLREFADELDRRNA